MNDIKNKKSKKNAGAATPSNVISFVKNSSSLCDMAHECYLNGDNEKALSLIVEAEKTGKLSASTLEAAATICFEVGLFSDCVDYWYKYLSSVSPKHFPLAYSGLGACFYVWRKFELMEYYFNERFRVKTEEEFPYDYFVFDLVDEMHYDIGKVKVVDKEYDRDRETLKNAKDLLEKKPQVADKMLEGISAKSHCFCDACLLRAAYRMSEEKYSEASALLEQALKKGDSERVVRCNLFGAYYMAGEEEKANEIFESLKKTGFEPPLDYRDYFEISKFAVILFHLPDAEKTFDFTKKALELFPRHLGLVYFAGFAAYNSGRFDFAADCFLRYYKATGRPYSEYYRKLALNAAAGAKLEEKLDYRFSYSDDYEEALIKRATKYAQLSESGLKRKIDEFMACVDDCFYAGNVRLQAICMDMLLAVGGSRVEKFIKNKLISYTLDDESKMMLVSSLVAMGEDKLTGVVYSGVYSRLQFELVDFPCEKANLFFDAYGMAFARLSPFVEDLSKIKIAAYDVYFRLIANGNLRKVNDVGAVAAAITLVSGVDTGFDSKGLGDYFFVTPAKLKKVLALIEAD